MLRQPLDGVIVKLWRAKKHLDELEPDMIAKRGKEYGVFRRHDVNAIEARPTKPRVERFEPSKAAILSPQAGPWEARCVRRTGEYHRLVIHAMRSRLRD